MAMVYRHAFNTTQFSIKKNDKVVNCKNESGCSADILLSTKPNKYKLFGISFRSLAGIIQEFVNSRPLAVTILQENSGEVCGESKACL